LHTIFKKIASFIWPVTKKIPSDINGDLELTWYQGKKVLDTKNANFSYGSLDLILNEAFKTTTIKAKDKVLILGLGGGNFIKKIRQDFNHTGHITAVELDSQIIKIAKEEFGILKDKNTTTLHQDALKFVQETSEKFDFIFVDIFVDNIVPEVFYSLKFWNKITTLLNPKGRFLFNAGITLKETNKIDLITNQLQTNLNITKKRNINGTNTLLFGTKV
jgi:ubiquinone/menaquinone biosynthesis C-methylase UbiE